LVIEANSNCFDRIARQIPFLGLRYLKLFQIIYHGLKAKICKVINYTDQVNESSL